VRVVRATLATVAAASRELEGTTNRRAIAAAREPGWDACADSQAADDAAADSLGRNASS
jgi:hypothetical protein